MDGVREPTEATLELRNKLVWLTVFRTVAVSLLLGTIVGRLFSRPEIHELSSEDSLSFVVIGAVYFLTLVYGLALRGGRAGVTSAYIQVFGDILLASALVYLTGGIESPFTFTYSLAVIGASILLFERGAVIAAAASALSLVSLALAINAGWLRPPSESTPLPLGRVAFLLLTNLLAQVLIAALATYLGRQLSRAGGALEEKELHLRQLGDLQREIVASIPSGLISCDRAGQVAFVNRAAAAILGVEVPFQGSVEALLPGVLGLPVPTRRAEVVVPTRGGEKVLGLTVTSLAALDGSLLIVFQDLTELRQVELELQRADRLAALGALSAQLAHEIRNPLAAMRGSAQLIAEETQEGAQATRLARILIREADRLSDLVESFLQFARPPAPQKRSTSVSQLVAETVEMVKVDPTSRRVRIGSELVEASAHLDPDQMKQVVLNLLRNAILAVEGGGEVRVQTNANEERVEIRVWDSAGSIAPESMPRLFEPFFSRRPGGTGLGLSTAHSIVRAHGGTIRVSSAAATGTEFVVTLPRTEEGRAQ